MLVFLRQRSPCLQDAEDLRQETLLKVYQNLERYDPGRPFAPWLMTIAARLAAGRARSGRSASPLEDDAVSREPHADSGADRRESGEVLWRAAARMLPAPQYRALRLRYVDQLDVRDVAGVMGVTLANAKVLLLRARRRLMESPQVRALLDGRPAAGEDGHAL